MPATALQSSTPRLSPDDWISLEEAARVLGLPERTARWRAAKQWSATGLAELRKADSGKPAWWVHREIDSRLTRFPDGASRDQRVRDDFMSLYPKHDCERAYRKAYWLQEWRRRCDVAARIAGQTDADIAAEVVRDAKAEEGDDFRISVRSLQLWRSAYGEIGSDGKIAGLRGVVDQYATTADPNGSRSLDAIEYFYGLYHTTNQKTVSDCHRATRIHAMQKNWSWPKSERGTAKWLSRHDNLPFTYFCREGKEAYDRKYRPYLQQDWSQIPPGHFYVADHTRCDFWVSYKGTQIRPWLTAVQDCGSRRIVGWVLGPAPHQEAILVAMRMAFGQAVPEYLRIDNGKDFTARSIVGMSKAERRQLLAQHGTDYKDVVRKARTMIVPDDDRWKGIVPSLGIQLIFAIPYNPQSKGTLERFFGRMHDQFDKNFASYCGRSPEHRPDTLQDVRDGRTFRGMKGLELVDTGGVPTIEQARASLEGWMTLYDLTPHHGLGLNGRTPAAVWNSAQKLRKAVETELDFLISVRGTYRVSANGVSLVAAGQTLSYGMADPALGRYRGRDVLVAVDPEYPARCLAFDPVNRRLIAALQPNKPIHPLATTDDLREGSATVAGIRKRTKRTRAEQYKACMTGSQMANQSVVARTREAVLAATGTDDARPDIVPVQVGFKADSNGPRFGAITAPAIARDLSDFDDIYTGSTGEEESETLEPLDNVLLSDERTDDDVDVLGEFG